MPKTNLCEKKGKKRNVLAIITTIVMINLLIHIFHLDLGVYEFSCLYMLLYLCINEVLK